MRRGLSSLLLMGMMLSLLILGFLVSRLAGAPLAIRAAAPLLTTTPSPTPACPPQWTTYPNPAPPGDSYLYAVTAAGPNDLWAVGALGNYSLGTTLAVHGDGMSWTQVPSPGAGTLNGVAAVASNDVWAVGYNPSGILTEHWDGTAWSVVPSPNPAGAYRQLYAVAAIASNDVWAVGTYKSGFWQTLTEHWNGSSWSIVPSPGTGPGYYRLYGVAAVAANDVWAVGENSGATMILHWDGSSWSAVSTPGSGTLRGVAAVASNDVWAVGYSFNGAVYQTVVEHWNGSSWTLVPNPNPGAGTNRLYAVSAQSANNVWAVGDTDQASGGLKTLALHWDGSTWTQVPTPDNPTGADHFYGALATGSVLWAVGSYGCVSGCTQAALIARYGSLCAPPTPTPQPCGLAWRRVLSPDAGGGVLNGVAAVAANDAWAVGNYDTAGPALIMHWDGGIWSIVPGAGGSLLNGVAAVAANDVWAVGSSGGQTLTEHWNGSSWAAVPSPSGGVLYAVAPVAANDIWAVGESGMTLIEHWNGSSWSIVPSPSPGSNAYLEGVAPVAANDVWAVGRFWAGGGPWQTLTLHWDGSSWSVVPSPNPGTGWNELAGVAAVAANDVWAVGEQISSAAATSLVEHWNGNSWSVVPAPGSYGLFGVAAVAANDIWAVGHGDGQTLIDHWDGSSWSLVPSPLGYLYGVAARASNDVWAVGKRDNGTLTLHYTDPCGGATSTPTNAPTWMPTNAAPTRTGTALPPTSTRTGTALPPTSTRTATVVAPTGTAAPPGPTLAPTSTFVVGTLVPSATRTLIPLTSTRAPSVTPRPSATPCTISFDDVQPTDYFYAPVRYLACGGVISGYADGTFRPYNNTTRAQMVKIVVLGFGLPLQTPAVPTFRDVPTSHPFYSFVETAAAHGIVSGYADGTFRPSADVTRGQLAKIVVGTAGWSLVNPPDRTFADVIPGTAFYEFVETAYCQGIISGYSCSGLGEPCGNPPRPYFRQNNNATRGQIAKIVYLALTTPGTCPAGAAP